MRGLIILADNFEDTEGIATIDVLKRARIEVDTVSFNKNKIVKSKFGHEMSTNYALNKVDYEQYDFLILPGGPAVWECLRESDKIEEIVQYFYKNKKLIAAICAAPSILGKMGLLRNIHFTCHPGFEDFGKNGIYHKDQGVCYDNNIITAKSMYYSIEFGLAIVRYYYGLDAKNGLEAALKGGE